MNDSKHYEADVLVLGAGLAGLSAAVAAATEAPGQKILVCSASSLGKGGCGWETHGINAAVHPSDDWRLHAKDSLAGGGWIGDPTLVNQMCAGIRESISMLEGWGIEFSRLPSDEYTLGTYGGSSFSRSLHNRDMTGLLIMNTLVSRAIELGVHLIDGRWILGLMRDSIGCCGAIVRDQETEAIELIRARNVILALGGGACVYPISSISQDKRGTGILSAYRVGVPLVDMEMVQFHPTGLLRPGSSSNGKLLEEEMRTLGGILRNAGGSRFMPEYDERGELATRDVVARSSFMEIRAGRGTENEGVWFDLSALSNSLLQDRFPNTLRRLRSAGVDLLESKMVEVSPTAHFLMGGATIDKHCRTSLGGLLVCGEDSGGIHGGNRLGGNGVADALVFGRIAGRQAARQIESFPCSGDSPENVSSVISGYYLPLREIQEIEAQIRKIMWSRVGLVRVRGGLALANKELKEIRESLAHKKIKFGVADSFLPKLALSGIGLFNLLELAEIITVSAVHRLNSVGAHYLEDPEESEECRYNVVVMQEQDGDSPSVSRKMGAELGEAGTEILAAKGLFDA